MYVDFIVIFTLSLGIDNKPFLALIPLDPFHKDHNVDDDTFMLLSILNYISSLLLFSQRSIKREKATAAEFQERSERESQTLKQQHSKVMEYKET